jgi:hypothetical protein
MHYRERGELCHKGMHCLEGQMGLMPKIAAIISFSCLELILD